MPKVSVIIPTYNRSEYLRKSIESVLKQTYQDYELLIIDDCSTDNTPDVVKEFSDSRVLYFKNLSNEGIAAVRNRGINNSKGEYIAFLDDDDEWIAVDKLEKQISLIESCSQDVGMIYTGYSNIDTNSGKKLKEATPKSRGNVLNEYLIKRFFTTSTLLIRKSCFDNVGPFDESISFGEDYDMYARILKLYKVDYIKEQMVNYRVHPKKLSTDYMAVNHGLRYIINKNIDLLEPNKQAHADLIFHLGVSYCYLGNTRKGTQTLLRAIYLYPYNLKYYYNFTLSLFGVKVFKTITDIRIALKNI